MTTHPIYGDPGEGKEFVCYGCDVPKRNLDGTVVTDINGNTIYLYRANQVIIDENGLPLTKDIKPTAFNSVPRVKFNGIRDGGLYPRCERAHLEDLRYMSSRDLSELYDKVSTEVRRRVMGGQQLDIEDNPHTVARL